MSYADEQEPEEEDSRPDTFEGLTIEKGIFITSSSENIRRMDKQDERKVEYRKIVEKLMKNTGILCRSDMEPAKIGDSEVTHAVTKEKTTFKDLWKDQTCVIIFLRRFG